MKTATYEAYAQRMQSVLRYIAQHLDGVIDIHRLAERAFMSPYHFHRVYVAMQGETVADTVRRLRLHRAALKLSTSATPIPRLAREAGYASVQAFTRAFRSGFGLAPAQYRAHADNGASPLAQPASWPKPQLGFSSADLRIETFEQVRVAALEHRGSYQAILPVFDRLLAWAQAQGFACTAQRRPFGLYYDDPASKPVAGLRSDACMEVPEGMYISATGDTKSVRELIIAGGSVAVWVHTGPYTGLDMVYRSLYNWLVHSGHEPRDEPSWEEYLNDPRTTPALLLRTAIRIPLHARA